MIAVDSSAIVAILFDESTAPALSRRLADEPRAGRRMSAASYVEVGTVLAGRVKTGEPLRAIADLDAFLERSGIEAVPVDVDQMRIALRARIEYGRGFGTAAGLNYGDCFSYALAKALDAPLLYIGDDFTHTDITPALSLGS